MSKHNKKKKAISSISSHKRVGNKLLNPFSSKGLNMKSLEWERDLMPEHLWIESLAIYVKGYWHNLYFEFLDMLDEYYKHEKYILLGFISDFGRIDPQYHKEIITKHKDLVQRAFTEPFGRLISYYPDSPCSWLLEGTDVKLDAEKDVQDLSDSVCRLYPAKDAYAGHIRAVPLNRIFKHEKIKIASNLEVIKYLPKYPQYCSDEEKYLVQSFARQTVQMYGPDINEGYTDNSWAKYFWRRNIELVPCRPYEIRKEKPKREINETNLKNLIDMISDNAENIGKYVDQIAISHKYDLYSPEKDEILLGLFSRVARFYINYCFSPNLWSRDMASIFLRCLLDTAITFVYLTEHGTEQEFIAFKSYGEGKEKLLLLHLQDNYPENKSLDGLSPEDIADELGGGFAVEMMDIELSDWTKKSARDMAKLIGFEKFYSLIYDPASADVHGSWHSLKSADLVRCIQPLHRFHRIPCYLNSKKNIETISFFNEIIIECINIGCSKLGFSEKNFKLNTIDEILSVGDIVKQNL